MSNDRQSVITARTWDFLRHRAAVNHGRVVLDAAEIVGTLDARFPNDPRPTVGEVYTALASLRAAGCIRGLAGRLAVVRH